MDNCWREGNRPIRQGSYNRNDVNPLRAGGQAVCFEGLCRP